MKIYRILSFIKTMKKQKCIICSVRTGKRICIINADALICPKCCAKTRSSVCEGCVFFDEAKKYEENKTIDVKKKIKEDEQKNTTPEFTVYLNPDIDDAVDNALMIAERNIDEGQRIMTKLLFKHPNYHSVQYGMGVIGILQNEDNKALTYFEKAVKINPIFIEAWFNKGTIHQKRLEVKEMVEAFRNVINYGEPKDKPVRHAKEIISHLEKSTKKDGLTLDEYLSLMDIFNDAFNDLKKGNYNKAVNGFNQVVAKYPTHVQSYGNLGLCYGILGLKQEALKNLDKALELDPKYEPAIINRKAIASLKEGEKLHDSSALSVDYYKDYSRNK